MLEMLEHIKMATALSEKIVKIKTDGIFISAVSRELGWSKRIILKLYDETKKRNLKSFREDQ